MTREEREKAIDLLDNLVGMIEDNQDNDYDFALKKGIEALKQEDVLDKIRAEIEQVKSIMNEEIINHNRKDLVNFVNGLNQSLAILNKYKGESEDKE